MANTGNEYQRADCAPRSSLGNGKISLTDWVQAGRYAAAIDPPTGAGGPIAPATNLNQPPEDGSGIGDQSNISNLRLGIWDFEFVNLPITNRRPTTNDFRPRIYTMAQSPNSIAIFCEGNGVESAGLIGLTLALPPNHHLEVGNRLIAVLTFRQRLGNIAPFLNPLAVEFADQPIAREVVSAEAQSLRANFAPGTQTPVITRLASAQTRRQ